jgi:S-DNA-T family DNA segregation ATPase FtsK/SpoIIIE
MFDDRDVRFDVFALGLLVLVVFLGLSLVSYDAADPIVELVYPFNQLYQPDVLTYPVSETTANWCGPWGSLVASVTLEALGIGAYYAVISLGILTTLLLMRRDVDSPVLRTVGWVLSLVGFTTLATLLLPWLTPGPVMGAGGYLGALGAGMLKMHFADLGGFILAASIFFAGLLLCTDYVLLHLGLMLGTLTVASLIGMNGRRTGREPLLKTSLADDEEIEGEEFEEEEEEFEGEEEMPVRVGGKRVVAAKLAAVDEEEEEDEYEEDEELVAAEEEDEYEEEEYDDEEDEDEEEEEELLVKTQATKAAAAAAAAGSTLLRAGHGRRRISPFRVHSPPDPSDREAVMSQLDSAALAEDESDYELPSTDLLSEPVEFCYEEQAKEVRRKAKVLEKTFASFGFQVKVVEIETGPVIAQYEIELEEGLRLSKITGLSDDVAIALRVPSVRIVAPIPGKNTVGIEVPNEERQLVQLREVMENSESKTRKMGIPLFLGKDVSGNPLSVDLASLPHLLIAGRTGTGKSVCLNAIIGSILMTRRPDEVRFLMIDPKMVELSGYKRLPHLMHPVVTDMRKAEAILAWAVEKMEERYSLLARAGVRHMNVYNQLSEDELMERIEPENEEERSAIPRHMPYIVIVADEIADLMMTAGKEVEQHIIRLAQKSRAVGIHLILATQKPTVDVITGLIKSNLPARIAFQVASRTDSRVVLDEMGAEKLLGNGDMLFLSPGTSTVMRGQGTFLSDQEINVIVEAVSTGEQNFVKELVQLKVESADEKTAAASRKNSDALYEAAVETVINEGRGSVSLLQRAHGIGYGRAARMIDFMAEDGIVGPYAGAQAREVLMSLSDWQASQGGGGDVAAADETANDIADRVLMDAAADVVDIKPTKKKSAAKPKPAAKPQPQKVAKPPVDEEEYEEELEDEIEEEVVAEEEDEAEDDEYEYVYEDEDGNVVPAAEAEDDEEYEYEEEEYEYEDEEYEESA